MLKNVMTTLLAVIVSLIFFFDGETVFANFAFWQQNKQSCPEGFIFVPKNTDYVANDFCTMAYESKAELNAGGAFDADGLGAGVGDHKPSSVPDNQPWRSISQAQATSECQSLGPNYDLISNAQWQTLSRNLESVASNWTGGSVGVGCVFQGNNGETSCGYNAPADPVSSSTDPRGILRLSNGQKIYDLAGNLNEYVRDNNTDTYGSNAFLADVTAVSHTATGTLDDGGTRSAKAQFGPLGSYSSANNSSGLGYGRFSDSNTTISRGGDSDDEERAGIFSMRSDSSSVSTNPIFGFRCVKVL